MIKKSDFLMAKSKNQQKSLKNHLKWVKMTKNSDKISPLRNDPPQVLAMGVDVGAKNRSKEGLIFKIPFTKLKNTKNHSKTWKTQKSTKSEKVLKIRKTEKQKKWQNVKSEKVKKWQNWNHQKMTKKVSKIDPPLKKAKMSLKWPKLTLCEIRAAWSGVFWVPGGTTGPGFKAEKGGMHS